MKRDSNQISSESKEEPGIPHHNGSFGVYFSHKIAKLQTIHTSSSVISDIFKNCVVFINGITNPPVEEIRRLVGLHGGEALAYRMGHVTHLICEYFTDAQLKQELSRKNFHSSKSKIYYVKASWVIDSIRLNCRQPESLYTPAGIKGRFGANIAAMLRRDSSSEATDHSHIINNDESYSASSSSKEVGGFRPSAFAPPVAEVIELCDTPDTNSLSLRNEDMQEFTLSQQQLLRSLPGDLRDDAMLQLRQFREQTRNALVMELSSPDDNSESHPRDNYIGDIGYSGANLNQEDFPGKESLQQLVDYVFSDRIYDFMSDYAFELLSLPTGLAIRQRLAVSKCLEDGRAFSEELVELLYHYGVWLIHVKGDFVLVRLLLKQLTNYDDHSCIRHHLERCIANLQAVLQRQLGGKIVL